MGEKMSKYTPGPWVASERGAYTDFDGASAVILGDDMRIAVVQHDGGAEAAANARLIAAAPEMLEALELVEAAHKMSLLTTGRGVHSATKKKWLSAVSAALAKARGETQ